MSLYNNYNVYIVHYKQIDFMNKTCVHLYDKNPKIFTGITRLPSPNYFLISFLLTVKTLWIRRTNDAFSDQDVQCPRQIVFPVRLWALISMIVSVT